MEGRKLSPPETALGDKILKLSLHETHEGVNAIVGTETARSALLAQYLPPDPGVVRLNRGIGRRFLAPSATRSSQNINDRSSVGQSIDSKMGSRSRFISCT